MLVLKLLPIMYVLAVFPYNLTSKCDNYFCGTQPTGVVTMAMEVLHNICNMCICGLPDMYAVGPWASGIHTQQILHAHVNSCNP